VLSHPPTLVRSTREGTPDACVHRAYHVGRPDVTDGEHQIPDLWEPLAKLPWWIRHIYGLEGEDVIRFVVLALRRGPHLRVVWPDHSPEVFRGPDWDKYLRLRNVTANWRTGHLVIRDKDTLDNPRHVPIEAEWELVIHAVSDWQARKRSAEAHAARASSSSEASLEPKPESRRRGGGRPPKYDWARVSVKLILMLQEIGVPAEGDGGQAELEGYVASLFPPDDCPTTSVIREWVSALIKAYRHELG
jgi:hypothetical protein